MASEDVLLKLFRLLYELPANPIVDELQDSFEALAAEVRELRKDKARLDRIFASMDAVINVRGPYDWETVANRYELDAAIGGEG